jgi:hypothetical protein
MARENMRIVVNNIAVDSPFALRRTPVISLS